MGFHRSIHDMRPQPSGITALAYHGIVSVSEPELSPYAISASMCPVVGGLSSRLDVAAAALPLSNQNCLPVVLCVWMIRRAQLLWHHHAYPLRHSSPPAPPSTHPFFSPGTASSAHKSAPPRIYPHKTRSSLTRSLRMIRDCDIRTDPPGSKRNDAVLPCESTNSCSL